MVKDIEENTIETILKQKKAEEKADSSKPVESSALVVNNEPAFSPVAAVPIETAAPNATLTTAAPITTLAPAAPNATLVPAAPIATLALAAPNATLATAAPVTGQAPVKVK